MTLEECKTACQLKGCLSFTYRTNACHLKDKCVDSNSPSMSGNTYGFVTYYKSSNICGKFWNFKPFPSSL